MTWSKVTVKKNIFNKGNRNKLCYVDEGRMPLFYCAELATSRRFKNKQNRNGDPVTLNSRTSRIYKLNASILLRRPISSSTVNLHVQLRRIDSRKQMKIVESENALKLIAKIDRVKWLERKVHKGQ